MIVCICIAVPSQILIVLYRLCKLTDNIGMRLGIDKCGVLAMRRGKEFECEGITIGRGDVKGETDHDGYKYLGIMERSNKKKCQN